MSGGWYKQHRNLSARPWFQDAQMVQLYHYLKERAYVTDGRYEGKVIRRGSCPVTRSELSEVTGMSLKTIDRILNKLLNYGEIIVKGNNRFSVITVCDYDTFDNTNSLFGTAVDTTADTTTDTAADTTLIYNKEERIKEYNNNLISFPYKKERENKDEVFEIKERYNKMFADKLPPCLRLSMPTRMMVAECLRRFGAASVDIVFEQILNEPFSMGANKTGFIARFQTIFEPKQYQGYLERAQLRKRKQATPQQPQPMKKVGVIEEQPQQSPKQGRREFLLSWVDAESISPSKRGQELLKSCYESGELDKLGIDWKPNNSLAI